MPLKIEYQHFASPCSRVELGTLEECCIDSPVSCHWFEVERPSLPQWCQQLHTRKPSCCVVSCAPTVSSAACTTAWWEQCYHGAVTFSPTKGPWSSRVHRILGKQQADKWRHSGVGGGGSHWPSNWFSSFHSDLGARCLNENRLVSLLAGGFAGFSYSLLGVVHNKNYVYFDATQVHWGFTFGRHFQIATAILFIWCFVVLYVQLLSPVRWCFTWKRGF